MKSDTIFTAEITKDTTSGWTCVVWDLSVAVLGTGKAVKVLASIDDYEFNATFLPIGGKHILPLRAAILKATDKKIGSLVEVNIRSQSDSRGRGADSERVL